MSDLDGLCFIRRGSTLVPADIHAEDWLRESVKDGKEIIVTARKARNPKHHRLFFGLIAKFMENVEGWNSPDEVLDAIKFATGHTRKQQKLDGSWFIRPRSISFAAMDQLKFKRFFDRAAFYLAERMGLDSADELIAEVKGEQEAKRADR